LIAGISLPSGYRMRHVASGSGMVEWRTTGAIGRLMIQHTYRCHGSAVDANNF